jgi:hypothetical protein
MADEITGSNGVPDANGPNGQNAQDDQTRPVKGWRKVTKRYRPQGGAQRGAAAVVVNEWGLVETNAESTQLLDQTAIARNIDATKDYMVDCLVDEEREVIGIYATTEAGPGAITIRRYRNGAGSRISFHIGAALAEAPQLRPDFKEVKCLVHLEDGPDGKPVLVIPVKAGKAQITQSRTPGAEVAASEDPEI